MVVPARTVRIPDADMTLMSALDVEQRHVEAIRDSAAAWIRHLVATHLAEGGHPEDIAAALWGPVPPLGQDRQLRKGRLTRVRQIHHQARKDPPFGGNGNLPEPFSSEIAALPDRFSQLKELEHRKQAAIDRYNEIAHDLRHLLLRLDTEGIPRAQIAEIRKVSQARVATMINQAKAEAGLPVPPQRGGRRSGTRLL